MKIQFSKLTFLLYLITFLVSSCQKSNMESEDTEIKSDFKSIHNNLGFSELNETSETNQANGDAFELAKFNGILDKTFARSGYVQTNIGNKAQVKSHAVQLDGSVIAGGFSYLQDGTSVFTLAKYNKDGSLNNGFGTNGIVQTKIGSESSINSILIDKDGSIITGGYSRGCGNIIYFTLAKYKKDGKLNYTFGSKGIVQTQIGTDSSYIQSIALLSNGSVLAAGYSFIGEDKAVMTLAEYNNYGTLNNEFGDEGIVQTQIDSYSQIQSVSVLNDGSIVAGGFVNGLHFAKLFALAKYHADGTLVQEFGNNGIKTIQVGMTSYILSIATTANGSVIAGGYSEGTNKLSYFAVAKFDPQGKLMLNFGDNGLILNELNIKLFSSYTCSILVLNDASVLAGGYSMGSDYSSLFTMRKYNEDGSIASDFGNNGVVQNKIGSYSFLNALTLQKDGSVVASGYGEKNGKVSFTIAKYK